MNYLDKLSRNISRKKRMQKINSNKKIITLAVVGVTFVGTISVLLAKKISEEIRNIIINNAKDADEEIDVNEGHSNEDISENMDQDVNEDTEEEIKRTLDKQRGKPMGAVGDALEEALDDIEDEEKNENEAKQ
ncbi:hypothetical protein [Clostridium sp.]|uniref:hypothetical protein n=1 Tax=Clostridium sp. TaxID=1506 RepID=UPI003D6D5E06